MGVGDALGKVFGGGNDYKFTMPPTMGPPRQPGETDQQYSQRQYDDYQKQNQSYTDQIGQAMGNKTIPQNVLDFGQANNTAGQQNALNQNLQGRMGQNINFGTQGSMGQQQGLINQILAQGRGEGPNPALDQLRMTTDQNAKQAAAQVASQRGINPALAARMAGQNVANVNQQAVGQAGLQSAQQQLGAQQLGGGLLGQQIGQQTQQAGMNAQQQAMYAQLLAGTLGQQRGQDISQATSQGQAGLNLMTQNLNAEAVRRQAQQAYQQMINNVYSSANATNAGIASQNANTNLQYGMGAMSGLSSMAQGAAGMMFAEGGEVPQPGTKVAEKKNEEFERLRKSKGVSEEEKMYMDMIDKKPSHMAQGGMANYLNYANQSPEAAFQGQLAMSGQSANQAGDQLQKTMSNFSSPLKRIMGSMFGDSAPIGGTPSLGGLKGGNEKFSLTGAPKEAEMGGLGVPGLVAPMFGISSGGKIGGTASRKGDSESNDTVPAMLSPGEIVIPRTAAQNPDDAHAFLDQVMSRHQGPNYGDVMAAKAHYHNMAHGGDMASCGYCYGGMT